MASKAPTSRTKKPSSSSSKAKKAKAPAANSTKTILKPPELRPQPAITTKVKPAAAVARTAVQIDEDDVLMAHGGGNAGFGRCGGRALGSKLEQTICDRLNNAGITHSHAPRHFEVRLADNQVAAYAPMLVLRGRGREGKSVVIECSDDADSAGLRKVAAFRTQYGQEFYVILVAPDEVLDEAPIAAFDESCPAINLNTLISRLAE
jgi:hypothetical protein